MIGTGSIPSLATNTFNHLQIAIQFSSREQCAWFIHVRLVAYFPSCVAGSGLTTSAIS
jgi:hypothetical protein